MRIRWTQPAVHDLSKICDYIEEHGTPATAGRVARSIYRAASSLHKFPHRGRPGRRPDTRELVLPNLPYIIVYRAEESAATVLRILHGAQMWP